MPAFPRTFREKQALQQARTIAALCASSHPQGRRFPVHRQVSRLGFFLLGRLPTKIWQWHMPPRQLHGYWDSLEFASNSRSANAPASFLSLIHI